jgi:hypothetical protein
MAGERDIDALCSAVKLLHIDLHQQKKTGTSGKKPVARPSRSV